MIEAPKRYAIIVGVSKYDDEISDLPCAKNDAALLKQALLQKSSGFSEERVYLLANGFESKTPVQTEIPTRANIFQKISYVCDAAGPEDLIFLYFAGHGSEISKTAYLLASDTRMDVLSQTALKVDDLNDMLMKSKAKCVLRVFDACRSSSAQGRGPLGRMTEGLHQSVMKCATGWASFSSCSSGEFAYEDADLNQGVFTFYFCEGMSGKARNQQGAVTMESLVDYVKTSVSIWCDRQTLKQTPHFQTDLSGSLVLSTDVELPESKEIPTKGAFAELISGIDQHLSRTPSDTRRLTFTSDEEWRAFAKALHSQLKAKLAELAHPGLQAIIGDLQPLQNFGVPWPEFHRSMASCGLGEEFTSMTSAFRVEFIPREVVLPRTSLVVAVIQFTFFYWIWYYHSFAPGGSFGRAFTPSPDKAIGFFTLKPSGARDAIKTDKVLTEILSRASRDILTWAEQLGKYVEGRIGPLREMGPIVE
jgi:hypothetical protein